MFKSYWPLQSSITLRGVELAGTGTVHVPIDRGRTLILSNVWHVPRSKENNISTFLLPDEHFAALKAYTGYPHEKRNESRHWDWNPNDIPTFSSKIVDSAEPGYIQKNQSSSTKVQSEERSTLKKYESSTSHALTPGRWIIDSGSGRHLCYQKEILTDFKEYEVPIYCQGVSSEPLKITGHGTVTIVTRSGTNLVLTGVDYAPDGPKTCANLLSTSQLFDSFGCVVTFYGDICSIAKVF